MDQPLTEYQKNLVTKDRDMTIEEYVKSLDDPDYRKFVEDRLTVLAVCCDQLTRVIHTLTDVMSEPAQTKEFKKLCGTRQELGRVSELLQTRFLGD